MQSADTVAPTGSQPLRVCQPGCFLESGSLLPPSAALRLFPLAGTATMYSAIVSTSVMDAIRRHRCTCRFPDASCLPIGVFPRKRLAFSATGGASPLSPSGVNTEAVFSASVYFCAKAFLRCPRSPVAQDLSAPPGLYLDPQHLFPAVMDKGKLRFTSPVRQNIHLPCGFPAGDRPQNGAPVSYMQQAA